MSEERGEMDAGVSQAPFGSLPDGRQATLFELRNGRGMTVCVSSYGGVVQSIRVPDGEGRVGDVVLGFPTLDGYLHDKGYFGALIGRYANRIREGQFTLDGREYRLPINNPPNHLHGGPCGFDTVLWDAEALGGGAPGVRLTHVSPAGDQGYPGRLSVEAIYRLGDGDALEVEFAAETEAPTIINFSQHTYFDLSAGAGGDALDHVLRLEADRFTPVDDTLIPTGELAAVDGTPFDFREPRRFGERIGDDDRQLEIAGGYDHNFVLRKHREHASLAARLEDPRSGRVLELWTTEPGLQLYSGNFLDGSARGKGGRTYGYRAALCLEPQHFPDSPNHPSFPSTVLRPGERFTSRTVYRFGSA
jgi:aldose 1-epimerase